MNSVKWAYLLCYCLPFTNGQGEAHVSNNVHELVGNAVLSTMKLSHQFLISYATRCRIQPEI